MSDKEDDSLLAIDLGPDTYASTAATDTPTSESRTHQSEAAFEQIKASYTALQHPGDGNLYSDLIRAVPALRANAEVGGEKVKLSKRDQQLLGYVVGELYWDGQYARIVELCERVWVRCVVDKRLEGSLGKWKSRALEKMRPGGP